jgi:cyclic di-GMP phosphodiesterase
MQTREVAIPGPAARVDSDRGVVLVADDDRSAVNLIRRLLTPKGYRVLSAANGHAAFETAVAELPDLALLDVNMPGLDGIETCRRLKAEPRTQLTPVVLLTDRDDRSSRLQGLIAGASEFVPRPFRGDELLARVRSLVRSKQLINELESAESLLFGLGQVVEARDPATAGHCERLANYATDLGRELHLLADDIATLHRGGFVHDIGKIGVPDAVLRKPGLLTADEYDIMKQHVIIGSDLADTTRSLKPLKPIIRWHHERLDGSGYPDGLRGDDIPLTAQIVGVVDVFDALTTARPYKPTLSLDLACSLLEGEVRSGWRRGDLVDAFVHVMRRTTTAS